ncbi:MAG: aminodeoxychorismate lyase [Gammaproteobacteria bacterium]|nr:aminodeoxychorismate lyase [Gammaproteobacteria bacterium]MBI5614769.1 aminodeoxychorismate lyase [Gammaproteobacteria bacterium]
MILVNGDVTPQIAVVDRGLAYGDGLFETIAVVDGALRHWPRHLDRLTQGCARLAIPLPDPDLIGRELDTALAGEARAVLKLTLTRGTGERGYRPPPAARPTRIVQRLPWPALASAPARLGLCAMRLGRNPALAGLKHLNRLEQVLGAAELDALDVDEALMRDDRGHCVAGTRTNVFAIRGATLATPDLGECGIAGIMRGLVLDRASRCGLAPHVATLMTADLIAADAVFLTNALVGLWPVAAFVDATGIEHRYAPCAALERLRHHFTVERLVP